MSRIAIAGASGYVGRLLADRLAGAGHQVSALGRHPDTLPTGERITAGHGRRGRPRGHRPRAGRVPTPPTTSSTPWPAAPGSRTATANWPRPSAGRQRSAGVGRIIYLGALGRGDLSAHLVSRQQVGAVLAASGVPVVELRAAVILGAGSISYEMLRSLTERLPVMVCPRWITTRLQPLAESDLLDYLAGSLVVPPGVYEIGAPDVTDYGAMMRTYAEARGLRPRRIFTVPFVTPSLSARWVDLVSPVDRRISHALIESLVNEVVVHDPERTFAAFGITPLPVREAVRRAISDEGDRVSAGLLDPTVSLGTGVYVIRCAARLEPDRIEAARDDLAQVGGDLAWYGVAWAWALRVASAGCSASGSGPSGPTGSRPGRWPTGGRWCGPTPTTWCWPRSGWFCGDGWLALHITDAPPGVEQAAAFRPKGLVGLAYWWVLVARPPGGLPGHGAGPGPPGPGTGDARWPSPPRTPAPVGQHQAP